MPRRRALFLALGGGLLTTLTVPPFGWWLLAVPGIALLVEALTGAGPRRRLAVGFMFGVGLYVPSLWWMTAFSLPGGIFVGVLEATFTGLGLLLTATFFGDSDGWRGWRLWCSVPAGLVAADALRCLWPFGGLPLGGIDLGQAAGPFAPLVTFGGRLLLVGVVAAAGVALHAGLRGDVRSAAVVASIAVLTVLAVNLAPDGTHQRGSLRIAAVQGGGPRGLRASEAASSRTYRNHATATETLGEPVDLILWPEDVVDTKRLGDGSGVEAQLSAIAKAHRATFVAGIVESGGPGEFRNAIVVWDPDGRKIDRFDKVRRVPYGEYFPGRKTIESLGLATLPTEEAVPGNAPGILNTPAGPLAVAVSYEGFFDDRARGGVRRGGEVLLIPTNASSYRTAQLPTQQIAAARLRALETGRWTVQAAPTGYSAIFDQHGRQLTRTRLGARQLIVETVQRRVGLTPYARWNDGPALVLAGVLGAAARLGGRRRNRAQARKT